VVEVFPGVFHWTVFHEPIQARVSSYYVEPARIVIDPKLPEGGLEELPGRPEQVVLTTGLHHRDAPQFADAFDIPIRALEEASERLGDALDIRPFSDREEIAPGVTGLKIDKLAPDEGALHLAVDAGALAFADGIHRYGGALGFFSDDLLGDHPREVKQGLKDAYRGLLTREFDHLLFAHGDPLVGGGKAALTDFVNSPVGEEDFGQAL
jgi:hypothetical protein